MENDMKVQRFDSLPLDATYFTDEGYLVDHPIVTSVGIFVYHNPDGSERRELRLPEEVFAEKSLASYKGKPIIVTHDAGYVDTDNVKEESIGTILSEGYRDGDDVRAEIIIHDTDSLKKYKMRELSCGYNLRLDETPGVWEGQPYDAIQRDIEINHLALVDKARAGEQARLNIDGQGHDCMKGEKLNMEKPPREPTVRPPRRSWPLLWRRSRNAVQSVLALRPMAALPQSRPLHRALPTMTPLLLRISLMPCRWSRTAVTAAILKVTPPICPAQWV